MALGWSHFRGVHRQDPFFTPGHNAPDHPGPVAPPGQPRIYPTSGPNLKSTLFGVSLHMEEMAFGWPHFRGVHEPNPLGAMGHNAPNVPEPMAPPGQPQIFLLPVRSQSIGFSTWALKS